MGETPCYEFVATRSQVESVEETEIGASLAQCFDHSGVGTRRAPLDDDSFYLLVYPLLKR